MGVKDKREEVLERIYSEMLTDSEIEVSKELAAIIKEVEAARIAEKEFELKDAVALTDNANKQIERELEDKIKRREVLVNAGISLLTGLFWGLIFVHEMKATRLFEIDGTETSAAGRWLKNSFPKVKLF